MAEAWDAVNVDDDACKYGAEVPCVGHDPDRDEYPKLLPPLAPVLTILWRDAEKNGA